MKEATNLERLKQSLTKSSEQTGSMLKVLDKFQERLHKLEVTIQPVYVQTRSYQIRQESEHPELKLFDFCTSFFADRISVVANISSVFFGTSGYVV